MYIVLYRFIPNVYNYVENPQNRHIICKNPKRKEYQIITL